jgi:hypothetical protein
MKLSEAIRLGAMMRPQAFGALQRTRRKYWVFGEPVRQSCALGAAIEAIGGCGARVEFANTDQETLRGNVKAGEQITILEAPPEWTELSAKTLCPVCAEPDSVRRLITHLNDTHRWSREAIADWVATIEAQCASHEAEPVSQEMRTTVTEAEGC